MKNIKLKQRLILGAIGMVILVMVSSQVVVAVLINKQNREIAHDQIEKGLNIVREDLLAAQAKLLSDTRQMAVANKMGAKLKYLNDFKKDTSIHLYISAYQTVTNTIHEIGRTGNLWKMAIYDMEGDLRSLAVKQGADTSILGYVHGAPQPIFFLAAYEEGAQLINSSWKKTESLPSLDLPLKFDGTLPDSEAVFFIRVGDSICLTALMPIIADVFNAKTKKVEKTQVGVISAVRKIDEPFIHKMSNLTGLPVNLFGADRLIFGALAEYAVPDVNNISHEEGQQILSDQEVTLNETDLDSGPHFQGILPFYNQSGFVGAVAVLYPKAKVQENTWQIIQLMSVVFLVCILLIVPFTIVFSKSIVKPITRISGRLDDLAEGEGDLTVRLEVKSDNEMDQLAKGFNTFMEKLMAMVKNIAGNADVLNQSSSDLTSLSDLMSEGAGRMSTTSNTASNSVNEISGGISTMAETMERTSTNMDAVSTAAEQMTATINEIAQNSEKARSITSEAVTQAQQTSDGLGELNSAAQKIGNVTETITEISDQTNLLALNATIEAARAGEAGRGFAVVANEIKDLAGQTAYATKEIKTSIQEIQGSISGSVSEVGQILGVINDINDIVSVIATAVEEQSATTLEIAQNVSDASQGIKDVNTHVTQTNTAIGEITQDMTAVDKGTEEISGQSSEVNVNAKDLSRLAEELKHMVNRFKF